MEIWVLTILLLQYGKTEWTLWDRFKINSDLTLQEFLDWFQKNHNLHISMVTSGSSLLYASFHPKAKLAERLPKKYVVCLQLFKRG